MTENFPNLVEEKDTQVQETQRVSNNLDPKKPALRHNIIKMTRLNGPGENSKTCQRKASSYLRGTIN